MYTTSVFGISTRPLKTKVGQHWHYFYHLCANNDDKDSDETNLGHHLFSNGNLA